MNYTVIIAPEAEQDVFWIKTYIERILLAPQAYENFEKAIFKTITRIENNPHVFPMFTVNGIAYRKAQIKKYLAIFRVDENSRTVHIIAFGHSLQRRKNILNHKKR